MIQTDLYKKWLINPIAKEQAITLLSTNLFATIAKELLLYK
jgi:hypothetical protein